MIFVVLLWALFSLVFLIFYKNYMSLKHIFEFCFVVFFFKLLVILFYLLLTTTTNYNEVFYLGHLVTPVLNFNCALLFKTTPMGLSFSSILVFALSLCFVFITHYSSFEYAAKSISLLSLFFSNSIFWYFLSSDLLLLVLYWEIINLVSFFLVQHWSFRLVSLKASIKVFLFSQISDLFLFLVLFLILSKTETTSLVSVNNRIFLWSFDYILLNNTGLNFAYTIQVLLSFTTMLKAAQGVFYPWLLDAMEAPVSISAQLHSSTLVIIGFYFLYLFKPLFLINTRPYNPLLLSATISIPFMSILALYQVDGKKLLACSTSSQLGYVLLTYSVGLSTGSFNILSFLCTYKAIIFISFGTIMHMFSGVSDLRLLRGGCTKTQTSVVVLWVLVLVASTVPGAPLLDVKSNWLGFSPYVKNNSVNLLLLTWALGLSYLVYLYKLVASGSLATTPNHSFVTYSTNLNFFNNAPRPLLAGVVLFLNPASFTLITPPLALGVSAANNLGFQYCLFF